MELPPGVRISFEEKPAPQDREFVNEALGDFNTAFLNDPFYASFAVFARDASRRIHAGLVGHVYADWLFIALLWVHEDLRRRGVGRSLIAEAEGRARGYGCHSAWVDTFSFQAPGFYQKLGYREFGRLDYPPGHQRIFLQKQFNTG